MIDPAGIPVIEGDMDALARHAAELIAVGDGFADTGARVHATWQGLRPVYAAPEAEQLFAATAPVQHVATAVGEDVATVGRALAGYAEQVREIQTRLELLRADATTLAADLAAHPAQVPAGVLVAGPALARADRAAALDAAVLAAVAEFDEAQRRCATTITALYGGTGYRPDDGDGHLEPGEYGHGLPPAAATPEQVAAWWNRLDPADQRYLLYTRPRLVGSLDGVPAAFRDQANRVLLGADIVTTDREIAAVAAALAALPATTVPSRIATKQTADRNALENQLADLQDRRDALTAIDDTLAVDPTGRHLLVYDPTGHDEPHAAVAVGDVDTAEHVAVFTPGFTTTVADSLPTTTASLTELRATTLDQLGRAGRPDADVAVVAWLGYDIPQWDTVLIADQSVALDTAARNGGADLARFFDGIAAARPDDPHLTAVGHSYGSTTTAHALAQTAVVDDAVLFGSPGITTDDPADLGLAPEHVGVIEARGDIVADLAAFGPDPNQVPDVTHLSAQEATDPTGGTLAEATGHEEYLAPRTTSQHNIAATVADLPGNRILTTDDSGFGDWFREWGI